MEFVIRRTGKGLDMLSPFRATAAASVQTEDGLYSFRFAAKLSLYIIHSIGDIFCPSARSIRFSPASAFANSSRSPPEPGKLL